MNESQPADRPGETTPPTQDYNRPTVFFSPMLRGAEVEFPHYRLPDHMAPPIVPPSTRGQQDSAASERPRPVPEPGDTPAPTEATSRPAGELPQTSAIPTETVQRFTENPRGVLREKSRELHKALKSCPENPEQRAALLDGYFRKVVALDRASHPAAPDDVQAGKIEGYIADGFTHLGPLKSLDPANRFARPEMNEVDTLGVLTRYKDVFEEIFSETEPTNDADIQANLYRDFVAVQKVAKAVDDGLPYGDPTHSEPDGTVRIGETPKGVCQQQGLTAQVLLQSLGINSRISLNSLEYTHPDGRLTWATGHVSNIVTFNTPTGPKECMLDVTNPNYNNGEWAPGIFVLPEKTASGAWEVPNADGRTRVYRERPIDTDYSTIRRTV
jgi:hypothetical protein